MAPNGVINFLSYVGTRRESTSSSAKRGRNAPRHAQINLRFANKQGAGFNYLSTDWLIDPKTFLLIARSDTARQYSIYLVARQTQTLPRQFFPSARSRATHALPVSLIYFSLMTDRWVDVIFGEAWQGVFNMLFAILIRYLDRERRRAVRFLVISAEHPLSVTLN